MSYQSCFRKAGVNPEEYDACMEWALGDGWENSAIESTGYRWNQRHEDIFTVYPFDEVDSTFVKIGKAYIEHGRKNVECS